MPLVVVKCGGAASKSSPEKQILPLHTAGNKVCVVHGAGPQISQEMKQRGIEVRFIEGRRYTSEETLEVVRKLFMEVNAQLLIQLGAKSIGMMGDQVGLRASRVEWLGLVGEPIPSAPRAIVTALEKGYIPVVAPLAEGPLNVNADDAAAALAVGLNADELLFFTDVPGVLVANHLAPLLEVKAIEKSLDAGEFNGGIVPKLKAASYAAKHGLQVKIGKTQITDSSFKEAKNGA